MKRFYLLFITLFLVISYVGSAQLTQTYKAREGESVAREKAAETMTDPDLFIVATLAGEFEGMPIKLEFDEEKGEATAWIYMFNGKVDDKDSALTILVIKSLMGMTAMQFDLGDLGGGLPFNPENGVDGVEWIDSDEMMDAIRENDNYRDFLDVFPDTKFFMGALLTEPMQNNTIWGITFINKDSLQLNCMVNAVSKETVCRAQISDVETNTIANDILNVYPNPASELTVINIPNQYISDNAELKVYDTMGNLIYNLNNLDINSDGQIALDVGGFVSGTYTLVYTGLNHTPLTARLVVVK